MLKPRKLASSEKPIGLVFSKNTYDCIPKYKQ